MEEVSNAGDNARVSVDLEQQIIVTPQGQTLHFDIDAHRKHVLLNGLDDIGQTLAKQEAITQFESSRPNWMSSL